MTNSEKTRILIEQTIASNARDFELWEFVRVPMKYTGLPYDIYVDNGGAYKHNRHKLWLYVDYNSEKIPITIEEHPMMLFFQKSYNFKYGKILKFIRVNRLLLKKMADEEIDDELFFQSLNKINEDDAIRHSLSSLNEMATLRRDKSGLPTIVWLDDNKLYEPHAPRIKFRADFQNKNTHYDPSMEVNDPQRMHDLPSKIDLDNSEIKQIQSFVTVNRDIILALANREIDFKEFLATMKKVDSYGNLVEKDVKIYKCINGFTKCEKNGKYNFITPNGDYLFGEFCLDEATDFTLYINGKILAYVTIGNESFYINSNGNKEEIQ